MIAPTRDEIDLLNLRIADRHRDSSRGMSTDELLALIDECLTERQ